MLLISAAVLFCLFAINVALGSMGAGAVLGDVSEMLVLFAASIVFVAAILQREAAEKDKKD